MHETFGENPSSARGGGMIHDHTSCILFAVSYSYDAQTNTTTEAMATGDGLLPCEERDLRENE